MNKQQRQLIVWGLIAIAIVTHFGFCQWGDSHWLHRDHKAIDMQIVHVGDLYLSARFIHPILGIIAGIIVPLVLVGAAAFVYVGRPQTEQKRTAPRSPHAITWIFLVHPA